VSLGLNKRMRASGERFAASFILLACIGPSTGFVPMGRISVELRQPDAVSMCAAVGTRPKPGMRSRINIRQQSARTSVAVQALPSEKKEVISEALRKSVVVEAAMEHCFQVASDLDSYTKWCSKGGMKKVIVMERNDDNLASKVQVCTQHL